MDNKEEIKRLDQINKTQQRQIDELKQQFETVRPLQPFVQNLEVIADSPTGETNTPLDAYPIGAIYMSYEATNPGSLFGGTWIRFAEGRVPTGFSTSDSDYDSPGKNGGSKTHTLTTAQMPQHSHSMVLSTQVINQGTGTVASPAFETGSSSTGNSGSGNAHNIRQPYTTCYMWRRTA